MQFCNLLICGALRSALFVRLPNGGKVDYNKIYLQRNERVKRTNTKKQIEEKGK